MEEEEAFALAPSVDVEGVRGVARGVVEPKLLLSPEVLLLLPEVLLLSALLVSSAFFLPLPFLGLFGLDIFAVCVGAS